MDWSILLAICFMAVIVYKLGKRSISQTSSQQIQDGQSSHITKGLENAADISSSIRQLQDKELLALAMDLQKRGNKIMTYLRQHPQTIHAAQRFIDSPLSAQVTFDSTTCVRSTLAKEATDLLQF